MSLATLEIVCENLPGLLTAIFLVGVGMGYWLFRLMRGGVPHDEGPRNNGADSGTFV